MAKTLADVHPDIIQTHILPLLDGPSLSSIANASSYLQTLVFSDEKLWSDICKSTWPSITHPRLHQIISTFPSGHRSFFRDSFPALVTDINNLNRSSDDHHPWPSQIISAVDIRYQNDIVYSKVEFTDTTEEFLFSDLRIKLNGDVASKSIDLIKVDDEVTLMSQLKESLSLNWILIDPTRKRAGNLSSVKPVMARKGWMNDDIHLLYAVVLPGCDNKMVQCRIQVVVGVDAMGILQVKEVMLELLDLDLCRLKGREFLVITQGALSEENNVRRKVVDDEDSLRRYREFKRISMNSFSHLQTDQLQSNNKEVQTRFHSMKAQIQYTISRLKAFEFLFCVMFVVVVLSWLLNLFSSI